MKIITEKPNAILNGRINTDSQSSGVPENVKEKIKDYFKVPNEKYENPITSSQEFGWYKGEKLNKNMKRFRIGCNETKYGDTYYAMKGRSVFAGKDGVIKHDIK